MFYDITHKPPGTIEWGVGQCCKTKDFTVISKHRLAVGFAVNLMSGWRNLSRNKNDSVKQDRPSMMRQFEVTVIHNHLLYLTALSIALSIHDQCLRLSICVHP